MADVIVDRKLCNSDEFPNDSMKEIELDLSEQIGKEKTVKVLLIKQNNRFYCMGPKCSHYSVPLVNGVIYKNRLRCFAHGACFDIRTGDIEDYPGLDCLPKYDIFVDAKRDIFIRASLNDLLNTKRLGNRFTNNKQRPESAASQTEHRPCTVNLKNYDRLSASLKDVKSRCLIIGSGAAGLLCLETLREAGYASNVTMITRESYLPYDRPKLSKAINSNIDNIKLRDETFLRAHQLNFIIDQEVDHIDFDSRQVHTKSGRLFDYDRLVISTGLRPTESSVNHVNGVFTLRSYEDAVKVQEYFAKIIKDLGNNRKPNIIAVGGSFICMEVATYFADKANVTVMSRRAPFESIFGSQVSNKVQLLHESKGVKFFKDAKFDIAEYKESKSGLLESVSLKDGSTWKADLVILAIGSRPMTDFLRNTSIKLTPEGFVYVNKNMMTNIPNVYAAGDIAYFPRSCLAGLETGHSSHVNIGHWGVASSQGRVAAEAIIELDRSTSNLSKSAPFKVVPFFWSTQFGKSIRFAGFNEGYAKVLFHEDKTKANLFKFAAFYLDSAEKCIGVCTLDWDPVCAVFAEALYNGIQVKKEHFDSDPFDLKKLLV